MAVPHSNISQHIHINDVKQCSRIVWVQSACSIQLFAQIWQNFSRLPSTSAVKSPCTVSFGQQHGYYTILHLSTHPYQWFEAVQQDCLGPQCLQQPASGSDLAELIKIINQQCPKIILHCQFWSTTWLCHTLTSLNTSISMIWISSAGLFVFTVPAAANFWLRFGRTFQDCHPAAP
jgi:hypothetical protein